jgi:hypothetical protein
MRRHPGLASDDVVDLEGALTMDWCLVPSALEEPMRQSRSAAMS